MASWQKVIPDISKQMFFAFEGVLFAGVTGGIVDLYGQFRLFSVVTQTVLCHCQQGCQMASFKTKKSQFG
jgi:hypothetical protein